MIATEYADAFGLALQAEDLGRARTIQTDGGQLGASDAGTCERKAVWTVTQQTPTDVPKKGRAQAGTYLHAGTLAAVQALFPHKLVEQELQVTLPSGVQIQVHPDEIDPTEPSVCDYKFTDSIHLARRNGASEAQQMQRAIQYYAALQNGLIHTDQGIVRNLFVNVADLDDRHVDQQPFSMESIHKADDWYQRVIYAVKNLEDGEPQWPYNMCRDFCPFFTRCRPPAPELNQPITSPELAVLVVQGFEASEQRKYWKALEDEIKDKVRGVSGRVDGLQVVTTQVNGARPHSKVEFREVAS